jgi:hypothetical protein
MFEIGLIIIVTIMVILYLKNRDHQKQQNDLVKLLNDEAIRKQNRIDQGGCDHD